MFQIPSFRLPDQVRHRLRSGRRRDREPVERLAWAILLALLILTLLPQATQADYQSGLDAYNAARYTTALDDWQAVVEAPSNKTNPTIYAETHYAIGMLYWMGQGVPVDYTEASKWIHKAAKLGHGGAQGKLGYMYTEGITVKQDHKQAFQWFSKAAKQGDVDGQYNLGIFYLNGWGTEQNKTMAAQYLAAASAQGDESAETVLQGLLPLPRHSGTGSEPGMTDPESIVLPTTWIQSQNPNHYTIQVIGLSKISSLENLVKGHKHLAPFATYTLQRNDKPLHLLIQGVYPNAEAARKASAKFPTTIQKQENLWIRKFQKIQELIK